MDLHGFVFTLFIVKSSTNQIPLHNNSYMHLFVSLCVCTHWLISHFVSFSHCLHVMGWTCMTPYSSLSMLILKGGPRWDGQLEILFIFIQLSFSISLFDWSLKRKQLRSCQSKSPGPLIRTGVISRTELPNHVWIFKRKWKEWHAEGAHPLSRLDV